MEILYDKKLQLVVILSIITYLGLRGIKLFQNTSFVFVFTFLMVYRINNHPEKSIFLAAIITFILGCMKNYEKFSSAEVFKINFNDDDIVTLGEGSFIDDQIPTKIIKKMNDITSFTIDDKYYVLITKKSSQGPQSFRGTYIIQNDNPFDGVAKIEVVKN